MSCKCGICGTPYKEVDKIFIVPDCECGKIEAVTLHRIAMDEAEKYFEQQSKATRAKEVMR